MKTLFSKSVLGTALAATAIVGALGVATPASAREWGGYEHHGGGGAGIAIAAGLIGLVAGVAIASDHDHRGPPPPVEYVPAPVAYAAPAACYNAYPGYDGYCYPASYYIQSGWGWRDGAWWYGGARYARPFVIGGYRGDYRYGGEAYRGGYRYGGDHDGYRGGYHDGGDHGGWRGGDRGRGDWHDHR